MVHLGNKTKCLILYLIFHPALGPSSSWTIASYIAKVSLRGPI